MLKRANFTSCVCRSKSVFVWFFLPPSVYCLLFFKIFCTTCEMATRPGVRINNEVNTSWRTARRTKPVIWLLFHTTFKKVPNWKTPGYNGVHGYWLKIFISMHNKLALGMDRCLEETDIPEWITKEKPLSSKKTPKKEPTPITSDP